VTGKKDSNPTKTKD